MSAAWSAPVGPGGDCLWTDGGEFPWDAPAATEVTRRDHRRRRQREPCELSPESQSSQRRIRRENERQRSLHMACTLMSVTSLTPGCGPDVVLTKYQRLSQLVRYTAFLEDATSALVKELGVRLNFDFSPVTRHIRRLRYQIQYGTGATDFSDDEADEIKKLLETMSAAEPQQAGLQASVDGARGGWRHRSAAAGGAAPRPGTAAAAAAASSSAAAGLSFSG